MAAARELAQGKDPPTDPKGYRLRGITCLLPRNTNSWAEAVAEWMDTRPETFRPGL
jgi:hypothetical protein